MALTTPSSDLISQAGRAAQDAGLAGLLGGNLFGRMALHPAVEHISDPRERGEVVNAAWRRYGTVNSLGVVALAGGWAAARADEVRGARTLTPQERRLARAKDVLVVTVAATGVLLAVEGIRFSRQAPHGAVPLQDGSTPSAGTPPAAARMKRKLNVLGGGALAAGGGVLTVNSALSPGNFPRPPLRGPVPAVGRPPLGG